MRWFGLKKKIMDERVVHTRNQIYKEAYFISLAICHVSAAIKLFIYDTGIEAAATELIIMLITSFYYMLRMIYLGVYSDEVEVHDRTSKISYSLKNILIGGAVGIGLGLFFAIRNATLYAEGTAQWIWYFILIFVVTLLFYSPVFIGFMALMHAAANKASRQRRGSIDDELDS